MNYTEIKNQQVSSGTPDTGRALVKGASLRDLTESALTVALLHPLQLTASALKNPKGVFSNKALAREYMRSFRGLYKDLYKNRPKDLKADVKDMIHDYRMAQARTAGLGAALAGGIGGGYIHA